MQYSIIQKSKLEGALRLDAEYYQPEYLDIAEKLRSSKFFRKFSGIIKNGNYGILPDSVDYIYDDSLKDFIYLIRGVDLRGLVINEEDLIKVPKEYFNPKAEAKEGDLLFLVKGATIDAEDSVVIVPKLSRQAVFNGSVFRPFLENEILSEYLYVFMRTKYFYKQKRRLVSNIGIEYNSRSEIDNYDFLITPLNFQKEIKNEIGKMFNLLSDSKSLYSQAENLLLEELGLRDFELEDDLSYVVSLSDVESADRIDAEYFQPIYNNLESIIKNFEFRKLGDIVSIKKGVEPGSEIYQEEGVPFIRVSNISKFGIKDNNQQCLSQENYNRFKDNFEPKAGEILLTKDATPGIAYFMDSQIEGIISGGILRLKPKIEIESEYLTLVINSTIGQMQAERDTGGSVIIHWRPEQIKNVLIPILPKSTQRKIADLVCQSHAARRKAKQLLEQSKQKVEDLIEKDNNIIPDKT